MQPVENDVSPMKFHGKWDFFYHSYRGSNETTEMKIDVQRSRSSVVSQLTSLQTCVHKPSHLLKHIS